MKIPTNKRHYSPMEIKLTLMVLAEHLASGDSIQLAITKTCGSTANKLAKAIRKDDQYLWILNDYIKKYGKRMAFKKVNGKIKFIETGYNYSYTSK